MSVCAICAAPIAGNAALCVAHHVGREREWAVANRLMCDLIHRGKVPPRSSGRQWDDELYEPRICELV